ncbi:hypothetical protein BPAE_0217g00070 [Botrytis paeoniae]|uniref:SRR1-like domain-containing protein n=1 Tax=Botrytis paeoniae TaxID=278948 RepID=A0A4Z1FA85_9HELO|nr:hypothetical protein BPAE_0217g00070 [Botrytis paeoniae]
MTSPMNVTESNNVNSHDLETEEGTSKPIATMTTPKDNRKSTNMEISTITASPIDTPFIPPAGHCDVGDIISYNKKWMILKSDGQRHETNEPMDFEIKFCGFEIADFFRERKASFGKLAALMKIMELLEIPLTARNVMQDPDFSPGDKRFLICLGFEVVDDLQGFETVNEETLVFQVGGYNCMNRRIMDRPWSAVFIAGEEG